jgi:hypothetical protein
MVEAPYDYRILRHKDAPGYATYSRLFDAKGLEIIVSLERPWVDADHNGHRDEGVSRFVPGLYRMFLRKAGTGVHHYDVWEFENVPDTKNAQIHIANWPWQVKACVATGTAFDEVLYEGPTTKIGSYDLVHGHRYPGVTGSSEAYAKWMKDSLALCAREGRDHIWVKVVDRFAA